MAPRSTPSLSLSLPAKPSHLRQNYTPKTPLLPRSPKYSYRTSSAHRLQLSSQLQTSSTNKYTTSSYRTYLRRTRDSRPGNPLPWLWRCHLCHTSYRLSTTNRCLNDGHIFCSIPPSPSGPESPLECLRIKQKAYLELDYERPNSEAPKRLNGRALLQISTSSLREVGFNIEQLKEKRQKKHASCTAQFDYDGWQAWNSWRRDVRAEDLAHTRTRIVSQAQCSSEDIDTKSNEQMNNFSEHLERIFSNSSQSSSGSEADLKIQKDCFHECNFPSECHHWDGASSRSGREENPVTSPFLMSLSSLKYNPGEEGRNMKRESKVRSVNWTARREILDRIYAEGVEERYFDELFNFAGIEENDAVGVNGGLGRLVEL